MQLIAQKEAADFVKTGAKEFRQNSEIRLTPGAKDIFTEAELKLFSTLPPRHPRLRQLQPRAVRPAITARMT